MASHLVTASRNTTAASSPLCPECGGAMAASELEALRTTTPRVRVGSPLPPRRPLLVWQCANCGIRSPRFDDCAA